jgi:hypothetical protein
MPGGLFASWLWACRIWPSRSWPMIYDRIVTLRDLARCARHASYKRIRTAGGSGDFLCGAAVRFLKPSFSVLSPPRKQAKPCRRILSTIDTTPSCCRSHLPLHHISLDREGRVVGALYVCISRRRRHLRRWIGSDREEETASTTTSSMFC